MDKPEQGKNNNSKLPMPLLLPPNQGAMPIQDNLSLESLRRNEPSIKSRSSKSSDISEISAVSQKKDNLQIEEQHEHLYETLKLINSIVAEVSALRRQVENFSGCSTDKEYKYLEEMMIRGTVELDNIETKGDQIVRQERKRAVQYIQKMMKILDARLKENKNIVSNRRQNNNSEDSDDDF